MPKLSLLSKEELIRELRAQKSAYGALKKKYDDEKNEFLMRKNMDQVLLDVLEGERAIEMPLFSDLISRNTFAVTNLTVVDILLDRGVFDYCDLGSYNAQGVSNLLLLSNIRG